MSYVVYSIFMSTAIPVVAFFISAYLNPLGSIEELLIIT